MIAYLQRRWNSVLNACRGGRWLLTTQPNARVHLVATLLAAIAGLTLRLTLAEWLLLTWSMALVWMAEAFNTALEFLADEVSLERRERLGKAKDIAAFAVLITSLAAAISGAVIFGSHLLP